MPDIGDDVLAEMEAAAVALAEGQQYGEAGTAERHAYLGRIGIRGVWDMLKAGVLVRDQGGAYRPRPTTPFDAYLKHRRRCEGCAWCDVWEGTIWDKALPVWDAATDEHFSNWALQATTIEILEQAQVRYLQEVARIKAVGKAAREQVAKCPNQFRSGSRGMATCRCGGPRIMCAWAGDESEGA